MKFSNKQLMIIAGIVLVALYVMRNNGYKFQRGGAQQPAPKPAAPMPVGAPLPTQEISGVVQAPEAAAPFTPSAPPHSQVQDIPHNTDVLPPAQPSNNFAPQGNFMPNATPSGVAQFPADMVTPSELLPTDGCFSASNPAVPAHLTDQNFLTSGHHAGINTQGSSLRNANYQLRSDPVIPRVDVGPWQQSTIESDTNRRVFEIGCA